MIKISALNDESEEDSRSEEEVTREALEQIALQQYAKALELQRKGNLADATQLLKDLLDTELLHEVKKPTNGEKVPGPLFNLKYLSYKNLASMLSASNEVEAAIDAYCTASELDDTDITLWHRLGQLCMRGQRFEMALNAFQKGVERNPKHWPCLDKIVTLLLALDYKEECITTIYETLQLDPGYLRGLVYRRHIFTSYKYVKDFMEYLNPNYTWNASEDESIDEEKAKILLKEADDIHNIHLEQENANKFKSIIPILKLKKPVNKLTWESVGESIVYMHQYMTDNCFSHACPIEFLFEKDDEPMDLSDTKPCEQLNSKPVQDNSNKDENKSEKQMNENSDNELSDKGKVLEADKVESDIEMSEPLADDGNDNVSEKNNQLEMEPQTDLPDNLCLSDKDNLPEKDNLNDRENILDSGNVSEKDNQSEKETPQDKELPTDKEPKKKTTGRRRSALSMLEQWEWCKKDTTRRSGRKKPVNRQDDNIYDILKQLIPVSLTPEVVNKTVVADTTVDMTISISEDKVDKDITEVIQYFGTDNEQKDVKQFINKFQEKNYDIIDILKHFLSLLATKWNMKWQKKLMQIFVEANKCYNCHIDIPSYSDDNAEELYHYTSVNLFVEEFLINEKLTCKTETNEGHNLSVIETIGIGLVLKPKLFPSTEILDIMLRQLWAKLHILILNKSEEYGLDCLYQLESELEAMEQIENTYSLEIINFTYKPLINASEVLEYIKFLERNKKLSTIMELYDKGQYEEVLSVVIDSFGYCKNIARNQNEEMSLDFAVQLSLILDTYWALDQVDNCLKWSFICLHEALKHYFRYTSGSPDYDKWTMTVVKILSSMEHIFTSEDLYCLDNISKKELSQGLDDIIRVIGHQVETVATEMPFDTVAPWIIMHFILQREEDQGRRLIFDKDKTNCDYVPEPLMVLFIAHEQLGNRGWCCYEKGKLLYFILDTVVPKLRAPYLSKSLEQVCQHMEQCVYCLYGHPGKRLKLKYLVDHNVTPYALEDWKRAQQLYEIFRPVTLPALEGKLTGISADTEQLFIRILKLLPAESSPQKYVPEVEKYLKGLEDKLPVIPPLLPFKMKDIYFLIGDYYFKKDEILSAIKYNMLDVVVNNDRLESWAEISLAKAANLERLLNSCKNLNNDQEFLIPAKLTIRCFKRSLEISPNHGVMWSEYGMFVYTVHSFCSRLLKQASESLSMEDFEFLEKQKEDMLDTTQKCFSTVMNDEPWVQYYVLGKVAEKRNKPPAVYLDYYMKGVNCLQESDATYPLKINYNSPTNLCVEVLELHYRIHASILKYVEQHENKPIPTSVGQVFTSCIEQWRNGPFARKMKKVGTSDDTSTSTDTKTSEPVQAANILKRSISDAGEDENTETKRLKLESAAAKVRRSASYDTETHKSERITNTEAPMETNTHIAENIQNVTETPNVEEKKDVAINNEIDSKLPEKENIGQLTSEKEQKGDIKKTEQTSSSSSSSSSSESSSTESSSDSTSDSSSDASANSNDAKPLPEEDIMKIVNACVEALEDCASRFPPHYKAIYRLAHYHFYYKKGKDIERCRDLMLSNFTSRNGQKLSGLFSERKTGNFFNNIWKIPSTEVDRAGGFAFHMNRSVLLTMEILKEIDDHKTLLDMSLHLQRIPEPDKKYLRDSDREELAQQAFSLCVQSLKGQLLKFSQQADLKSNEVERQALKSFMRDIYKAYQRVQKQSNSKQFTNLLVEAYKLITTTPITENMNLVDLSLKYCYSINQTIKQQAIQASLDKSQNAQKKQTAKAVEAATAKVSSVTPRIPSKLEQKSTSVPASSASSTASLPMMFPQDMTAAFQNYSQTAAALSLWSNFSSFAPALQSSLQNSFQQEFFRRLLGQTHSAFNTPPPKQKRGPKPGSSRSMTSQSKSSKPYTVPPAPLNTVSTSTAPAQKSLSTPMMPSMGTVLPSLPASMTAKSFGATTIHSSLAMSQSPLPKISQTHPSVSKPSLTNVSISKPSQPNISISKPSQAHSSSSVLASVHNKPAMPLHSSGKTLQEKLAERQKNLPISKGSGDISASINKLPSSLTITKTSIPKQPSSQTKKPEIRKPIPISRPKPITSDEVIVLDDD